MSLLLLEASEKAIIWEQANSTLRAKLIRSNFLETCKFREMLSEHVRFTAAHSTILPPSTLWPVEKKGSILSE